MAISMNPANLVAAQAFLKQVGMAVDPASSRGVKVSVEEANKIATAFEAIPDAGTKAAVGKALMGLIQMDLFEVPSKTAQDVIAKVIGKPSAEVFSAREKADLVGGASIKSVAAATMGLLAKMPSLDKGQVDKLIKGLDGIPKEAKNLVMAVLNKSSKDGEVKFQPDARPVFTKAFAKAEASSEGAVSKMESSFTQKADSNFEFFAAQMSASPYFEDRLAALMFMICAKTMKEVDSDLKSLDNVVVDDKKKGPKNTKPLTSPATGQMGQINKGPGQANNTTQNLRSSYESLVQSAASHRADDGVINKSEAEALVKKLDAISPPEAKTLQAEAMGRAILATGGGSLTDEMKPLADWVEKTTGKPLAQLGDAKALYEAKTSLAATIGGSDKLENKVAAFILEGVFGDGKAPKMAAVMNEMKPLMSAMESQVTGKTVAETKLEQPKTSQHSINIEDRFSRIATAVQSGKIPVAELGNTAKTLVDRLPIGTDKKAILEGVTAGLTALAGDKSLDVKSVFTKAVSPLVEASTKGSPEFESLVGGAVDRSRNAVSEALYNQTDIGKAPTPAQAKATLEGTLKDAKAQVMAEAKSQGYDAAQLEALGVAFENEANPLRAELEKTGKLQTVEPRGFNTDVANPTGTDESRSRQIMFETLKLKMTRLSEMMQAMSNILNAVHQTAENAVRAIR
jgi:hypothetical protein